MPPIKSLVLERCALLTASISLNKEIISPYSRCIKKGLVYIIIISPSSYQPSSCLKYPKANTYLLYNVRLVSLNKCIFSYYCICFYIYYSLLMP